MYDRLYEAFREMRNFDKKDVDPWLAPYEIDLPDGSSIYVTTEYVRSGYKIFFFDRLQQWRLYRHGYLFFGQEDLLEDDNAIWNDWIELSWGKKNQVSEEQRNQYSAFLKRHKLRLNKTNPYPYMRKHMHGSAYTQDIPDDEVERIAMALEGMMDAARAIKEDAEKAEKCKEVYRISVFGSPDGKTTMVVNVTWQADHLSEVGFETIEEAEWSAVPRFVAPDEEFQRQLDRVSALPGRETVQVCLRSLNQIYDHAFGEKPTIPAVLMMYDKAKEPVWQVMADYQAEQELVWKTLMDFLEKRGAKPDQVCYWGESEITTLTVFGPLFYELGIPMQKEKGRNDTFDDLQREIITQLDAREKESAKAVLNQLPPQSYVFRASLRTGRYAESACTREIRIDQKDTFFDLHTAIRESVDFDDDHAFTFDVPRWLRNEGTIGGYPDPEQELEGTSLASTIPLAFANLRKGDKLEYTYDMGDCWRFEVTLLQVIQEDTENAQVLRRVGHDPMQYPNLW